MLIVNTPKTRNTGLIAPEANLEIFADYKKFILPYEIKLLLKNKSGNKYQRDIYKYKKHHIDIYYIKTFPVDRKVSLRPDSVRFLLSLYPSKDDLYELNKIVLYPVFKNIKNKELISIYNFNKKLLIFFLHKQYLYKVNNIKYFEFSTLRHPRHIGYLKGINSIYNNTGLIKIPPLWYLLSKIQSFHKHCLPDNLLMKRHVNFIYNQ
jgi:hypothetical protein